MFAAPDLAVVCCVALLSAAAGIWWINRAPKHGTAGHEGDETALLFDSGILQHGSETALASLSLQPGQHDWGDIRAALAPRFPGFPEMAGSGRSGSISLKANDKRAPSHLRIVWRDPLCWVTLSQLPRSTRRSPKVHETAELAALRRASDSNPNPVWQVNRHGSVIWYNAAYATLYESRYKTPPDPNHPLFDGNLDRLKKRVSLPGEGAELPAWYEVTPVILDEATVFHATCVNAVVTAEVAQRNFVQTLAKTFAHLSIGLAIFDRNGQLALFNPALIDLTALPAQFLSTRPTMISFFDQLRENRHMPEPKNYLNWRQEITAVIAAAEDGRYEEIWTLDSGRTYRVRGRPHPDGATAFLIEDISAEVALTRNFRADLELCQSLLDTLEDGLALFSVSGVLTFSNARYRSLWCLNPQATFADVTITDSIDAWRQLCAPNPMWRDIEDSVLNLESCENWHMPLRLRNGEALICHIAPVATGATLIRFQQVTPEPDLPVIARERSLD